jgi:hypothetical protein
LFATPSCLEEVYSQLKIQRGRRGSHGDEAEEAPDVDHRYDTMK